MIYHITSQILWQQAQLNGYYEPLHFKSEGFIHTSTALQVEATANRIFKDQVDLVLLSIDENILNCEVKYENLDGGKELYPHIYGTLPLNAVVSYQELLPNAQGVFKIKLNES